MWASSQMPSTQGSQVHMGSILPSGVHPSTVPGHHRLPSLSSPSVPQIPAQSIYQTKTYHGGPQHQDPFYTSPAAMNVPSPSHMLHSNLTLPIHSAHLHGSSNSLVGFQGHPGGYLSQLEGNGYAQPDIPSFGMGYHSPGRSQDLRMTGLQSNGQFKGQSNGPGQFSDQSNGQPNGLSSFTSIWGNHGQG